MKEKLKDKRKLFILVPFYMFVFVFVLMPLFYMFILSFREQDGLWSLSDSFSFKNYLNILNPVYMETFSQSFKLAFASTFFVCIIGYPFGYFTAKLKDRKKKAVLFLLILPFWINSLIRLYGWMIFFRTGGVLDRVLMSMSFISEPLKWLYSYPVVVLGMVYMLLPFMVMSVYSVVEKMDWSHVEAARNLGASEWTAFRTITFRETLPGLFTGIILTFVPSMGLFYIADILGGNKVVLVGNVIQDQLLRVHNWPFAASLSVVLMLLTIIMLILYKKMFGEKL